MTDSTEISITKIQRESVTVHCCSSPDSGERVNAQIIELQNTLVIVDAMLMRPHAKALRDYANALGKPIDRLFITHGHPDHWFGAEYFQDVDRYALPETTQEIQYSAQFSIGYHRGQHGELITDVPVLPNKEVGEGEVLIDGVRFLVHKIQSAEDLNMIALSIPSEKVLIAQDLIYNQVHFFVGQKAADGTLCFDGWIEALKQFDRFGYDVVLPGHGVPADGSVFKENIAALEKMRTIFSGSTAENFVQNTLDAFPGYGLRSMVEFSAFFLFQMKQG